MSYTCPKNVLGDRKMPKRKRKKPKVEQNVAGSSIAEANQQ